MIIMIIKAMIIMIIKAMIIIITKEMIIMIIKEMIILIIIIQTDSITNTTPQLGLSVCHLMVIGSNLTNSNPRQSRRTNMDLI